MADWSDLLPGVTGGLGLAEYNQQSQNNVLNRQIGQQNLATSQYELQHAQTADVAKQQQEQQYQAWAADYARNPTPQKLLQGTTLFPEKYQALKTGWAVKDEAQSKADLGFFSNIVGALSGKTPRIDLALSTIDQRLAAEKAAGIDTTQEQAWRDALATGNPAQQASAIAALKATAYGQIAAATGPDKFADTYGAVTKDASGRVLRPGDQVLGPNNELVYSVPFQPQYKTVGPNQNLVEIPGGGGQPSGGGGDPYNVVLGNGKYGTPPTPLTSMTLGQVYAFGRSKLIPNSKAAGVGTDSRGTIGSSAVGAYGITGETMKRFAPVVLGPDWQKQQFTPQVQDQLGEAIYNDAQAKGTPLNKVWASLSPAEAEALKGQPWESARAAIMAGESGGQAAPGGARVIARGQAAGGTGDAGGASADAVNNDAEAYIQNGLKMPSGSARNQAYQTAVRNRAAEMMKERGLNPIDAMRGGQDFKAAAKFVSDLASTKPGTAGGIVRSMNVSIDHLAQLRRAMQALQNGDVPAFNGISQWWQRSTGQPLPSEAKALGSVVAGEINKAIIGGAGALEDRRGLLDQIPTYNSPAQFNGVIDTFVDAMKAQASGVLRQYVASTGRDKKSFSKYVSPRVAKLLGLDAGGSGGAAPVKVRTLQEAMALPKGTHFIDPYGRQKIR